MCVISLRLTKPPVSSECSDGWHPLEHLTVSLQSTVKSILRHRWSGWRDYTHARSAMAISAQTHGGTSTRTRMHARVSLTRYVELLSCYAQGHDLQLS